MGIFFSMFLVFFGSAVPASAHSSVSGTTPADGDVVATSPALFQMTFNEQVTVLDGFFRVVDSSGTVTALNGVKLTTRENGTFAEVTLPGDLKGWNAVGWKAISSDGHTIEGTVTFVVGTNAPVDATANQDAVAKLNADPLAIWRTIATAIRSVNYVATLIAVGGLGFLWTFRRAARRWSPTEPASNSDANGNNTFDTATLEKPTIRFVTIAAVVGALAAPVALALNTYLLNGGTLDGIGTAFSIQVGTPVGLAQLIRVSAFFAFCTAALLVVDRATKKFGIGIGIVAAAALVVSYSLSGHATIVKWDTISAVALVVHLGAAALWAGGLIALGATLRASRKNPRAGAAVADAFSHLATISILILFPAAIVLSATMFTKPVELFTTAYGIRLLGKFAIVLTIAAVGAYNHFVLIPKLRRAADEVLISKLRRSAILEVIGVGAVVIATTLLTNQGAPAAGGSHVAHLGGAAQQVEIDPTTSDVVENAQPVIARGVFGEGELQLTVSPARAATSNTIKISFIDASGVQTTVQGPVKVRIYLPGSDLVPIEREAVISSDGWQLQTNDFGFGGAWRVEVTASITSLNTPTGEVTVAIRPAS